MASLMIPHPFYLDTKKGNIFFYVLLLWLISSTAITTSTKEIKMSIFNSDLSYILFPFGCSKGASNSTSAKHIPGSFQGSFSQQMARWPSLRSLEHARPSPDSSCICFSQPRDCSAHVLLILLLLLIPKLLFILQISSFSLAANS